MYQEYYFGNATEAQKKTEKNWNNIQQIVRDYVTQYGMHHQR